MDKFWESIVTIALGIIGVATVTVIVSRKAQTPAVIQAAASGFGNSLAVAEAPVTGASTNIDLSYPSSGFLSGQGFSGFAPNYGVSGF